MTETPAAISDAASPKAAQKGRQRVYRADGSIAHNGAWDPRALFDVLSNGDPDRWRGRRVLDIGANSCGLSLEIARRGASVLAIEPDPAGFLITRIGGLLREIIDEEGLDMDFNQKGLFDAADLGAFDDVVCCGLLYHWRAPQYVLDYLSTVEHEYLFLGTHTSEGDGLHLYNRLDPNCGFPEGHFGDLIITGWHPTRPMLERMLMGAGFADVHWLTSKEYNFPQRPPGLKDMNSAYLRARRDHAVDPIALLQHYHPR